MKKKRLKFGAKTKIDKFPEEVGRILEGIASLLKEPDESIEDWLRWAFVSDQSSLADFFYLDSELIEFGNSIGVPNLTMKVLICDLAETLHQRTTDKQAN